MSPVVVGLALVWVVVGFGCWLGYQLVLQNGRLLLRLEALEQQLAHLSPPLPPAPGLPTGLPVGSVPLDFDLPDLSGGRMTLSQWRGRPVLLIFFNPRCGFCRQMLPDLAALPADPVDGRPVPLILTTGDAEENRALIGEYGIRCSVLLQEHMEVASLYGVGGTPMGYLIDEQGRTASEIAAGAPALLALALATPSGSSERAGNGAAPGGTGGNGYTVHRDTRSPAGSRINRNGLAAGTQAPIFRLPRIDGGELSLEEYRGRRVLLVFSDPACGPCDELAPKLERLHRESLDLEVLMISRRDREANQAKVAEHGLTFPVVLQRHWEISRDYGMFATPIGYLIDERGVIAAEVAVGAEAILALASGSAGRSSRKEGVAME